MLSIFSWSVPSLHWERAQWFSKMRLMHWRRRRRPSGAATGPCRRPCGIGARPFPTYMSLIPPAPPSPSPNYGPSTERKTLNRRRRWLCHTPSRHFPICNRNNKVQQERVEHQIQPQQILQFEEVLAYNPNIDRSNEETFFLLKS